MLPDDAKLLSELAQHALEADQRDAALALYDRVLALAVPHDGEERLIYLRALNNACVQAHAAGAFDAAAALSTSADGRTFNVTGSKTTAPIALDDVLEDAHRNSALLFEFGRTLAKSALRREPS